MHDDTQVARIEGLRHTTGNRYAQRGWTFLERLWAAMKDFSQYNYLCGPPDADEEGAWAVCVARMRT